MRTRILAAVTFAALGASLPVSAATQYPPVSVTLDVSILHDDVDHAGCALTVKRDSQGRANGFDVLDEAVARGCIDSYESVDFGVYGRFLTCIDDLCGQDAPTWALPVPVAYAGTTWSFTVNDKTATTGLDTFNARAGDEIGLTYSHYLFTV